MKKRILTIKTQPVNGANGRLGKGYCEYMKNEHVFKSGNSATGQAQLPPESPRANPDNLSEEDEYFHVDEITKEVQGRVDKLLKLAKQILTEQQYNVFIMMAVKDPCLTERETAKVLSVSPARVHQLWAKARLKLEKAYYERTA